jgi:hypothetical protein
MRHLVSDFLSGMEDLDRPPLDAAQRALVQVQATAHAAAQVAA